MLAVVQSLYLPVLCSAGEPGIPSQGSLHQGPQGVRLVPGAALLHSCLETSGPCLAARSSGWAWDHLQEARCWCKAGQGGRGSLLEHLGAP